MTAGSPRWAERDRVGAGLEVLGAGLDAYLTHSYGPDWPNLLAAHDATRDIGGKSYVRRDPQCGLRMLTERVAGVAALLEEQRRMASRVREIRDAWAYFAPFSTKEPPTLCA